MAERNDRVRDAFQDDSLGPSDRDRLWSTMQLRQTRQARMRYLMRAGWLVFASAIVAAWAFLRSAPRPTDHRLAGVVAAIDSLQTNSPSELPMTQNREEVPSNLLPLLGHRSSLRNDIVNAEQRRDDLVRRLEQTTGREHDRVEQELTAVEQQLEASRLAIRVIDRELMGHEVVPTHTEVAPGALPQVIQVKQLMADGVVYAAGGAGGLLLFVMLSLLVYMRRIARATREALSLIEGQVSSQHATLASGIDAIALEVERLGEGQRFMSKILAPSEGKARAHD